MTQKRLSCLFVMVVAVMMIMASQSGKADNVKHAKVLIHPVQGQSLTGSLDLTQTRDGLKISGEFSRLKPGKHGLHVHRYGNCAAPGDGSVGKHYAKYENKSGYRGDLPPVEAGRDGKADYETVAKALSLAGEYSVIGRSVVIHSLEDDKIGCGVIGISQ